MTNDLNIIFKKIKSKGLVYSILYTAKEIKYKFLTILGVSYSQRGEDLIINKLLGNKDKGFYVDVGAYNPFKLSNTLKFYKKGWSGINIEPQKANYNLFVKHRTRDINLNFGIGKKEEELEFFEMSPESLSTFSEKEAKVNKALGYKLKRVSKIKIYRLDNILVKYLNKHHIDFMSIDTEGYDLDVLQSNNWNKFKPKVICIESKKDNGLQEKFLSSKGYSKVADNGLNSIFLLR